MPEEGALREDKWRLHEVRLPTRTNPYVYERGITRKSLIDRRAGKPLVLLPCPGGCDFRMAFSNGFFPAPVLPEPCQPV